MRSAVLTETCHNRYAGHAQTHNICDKQVLVESSLSALDRVRPSNSQEHVAIRRLGVLRKKGTLRKRVHAHVHTLAPPRVTGFAHARAHTHTHRERERQHVCMGKNARAVGKHAHPHTHPLHPHTMSPPTSLVFPRFTLISPALPSNTGPVSSHSPRCPISDHHPAIPPGTRFSKPCQ